MQTIRLYGRQIAKDDQAKIFEGLSHPDVIKYYGVSFDTFEATQEQMDWFANLESEEKGQWWALCLKSNDEFVGAGGFNDWDHVHRKAEIGFWLLPNYWGRGIMTECMPEICNYGFEEMNLNRIEGFVESENMLCKKAMTKLKFVHEGRMRNCEFKNGKFIHVDIYSKLKSDD